MLNSRIIARVFSQVLILEGILLLVSGAVSWIYNEPAAKSFLFSAIITLVTGILVFTPLRHQEKVYGSREGFIIYTFIWILFGAFGSLPYLFTSSAGNFTDGFLNRYPDLQQQEQLFSGILNLFPGVYYSGEALRNGSEE